MAAARRSNLTEEGLNAQCQKYMVDSDEFLPVYSAM
jgi:hypothetical protein